MDKMVVEPCTVGYSRDSKHAVGHRLELGTTDWLTTTRTRPGNTFLSGFVDVVQRLQSTIQSIAASSAMFTTFRHSVQTTVAGRVVRGRRYPVTATALTVDGRRTDRCRACFSDSVNPGLQYVVTMHYKMGYYDELGINRTITVNYLLISFQHHTDNDQRRVYCYINKSESCMAAKHSSFLSFVFIRTQN